MVKVMNLINNEQVGISAEIAIADFFNVAISPSYRNRGVASIINSITPAVSNIFTSNNIPTPTKHVAADHNAIDFILMDNKTLSVKTNKQKLGKVAPQTIGQPSSNTWFAILSDRLGIHIIPADYAEKVELFKTIVLTRTEELLAIYWEHMFDCDFLIHIFNVVDDNDTPTNSPDFIVVKKSASPIWHQAKITFTQPTISGWRESNTVKYDGVTIGEFQIHNNRNNFKFRFDMFGITKLIRENRLNFS
jgi:hypothetical protein